MSLAYFIKSEYKLKIPSIDFPNVICVISLIIFVCVVCLFFIIVIVYA